MNNIHDVKNFLLLNKYPKFYLKDRSKQFEFFALGENGNIPHFKLLLQGFDQHIDNSWKQAIKTTIIPQSVIFKTSENIVELGCKISEPTPKTSTLYTDMQFSEIDLFPNYELYSKLFNKVKTAINKEELQKIVLARKRVFSLRGDLNLIDAANYLESNTSNCYIYCICLDSRHYCIGATPERLFKQSGNVIASEAVAGTAEKEKDDILNTSKNSHENDLVVQHIVQQMQSISTNIEISEPYKITPSNISHLKCDIRGKLKEYLSIEHISGLLHPTPAMAGYPRKEAMNFLEQECFARGLYSGIFGFEYEKLQEVLVLIRGFFVNNNNLEIYVGSGIVNTSSLEDEWNELNFKEQLLLNYLQFIKR